MPASMSDHNPTEAPRISESIARDIASAAEMADRLGLDAVVTILREAEDMAMRRAGMRSDPDRPLILH